MQSSYFGQANAQIASAQIDIISYNQRAVTAPQLANQLQSAFNDHIIRSKWNYQFTRALSLRFIMQYHALLANPNFTSLSPDKGLNTDVLVTWLLNPGTAVYVGYNTNLANPTPVFLGPGQPPDRFVNDSRGVFVKASYLFRF